MFSLFPGKCILCEMPSKRCGDLCVECEQALPWRVVTNNFAPHLCNRVVAALHYEFPVDKLVIGLKFGGKLVYGRVLGELIAKYLALYYRDKKLPQVIIPVPLSKNRLRERGFNQALELAKPIAKKLLLPIERELCWRCKNTHAQSQLSEHKRHTNIQNAFAIKRCLPYQHVAIIDDVVTTGNTISELCKTLCNVGITKIDVWSCAKT